MSDWIGTRSKSRNQGHSVNLVSFHAWYQLALWAENNGCLRSNQTLSSTLSQMASKCELPPALDWAVQTYKTNRLIWNSLTVEMVRWLCAGAPVCPLSFHSPVGRDSHQLTCSEAKQRQIQRWYLDNRDLYHSRHYPSPQSGTISERMVFYEDDERGNVRISRAKMRTYRRKR